ncbi:hypothetical protein LY474_38155 [Myxococcus stipitatus]|uniref:hypothetical protein n=1 Tax=Myxococcus stipitatus TaxID=83455 RepID=UPI001F2C3881|nr:hypothetical protein [Myxococcus stipitatus]MCE9673644.1 hypothetical protein [Myxococcus stipitatus]
MPTKAPWYRVLARRLKDWAESVLFEEESDFAAALAESRFVTGPVKSPSPEPRPAPPVSVTAPSMVSESPEHWRHDAQARGGATPPVDWMARVRKVAPHLVDGLADAAPAMSVPARSPEPASPPRVPSASLGRPVTARTTPRERMGSLPPVSPRRITPPGRTLAAAPSPHVPVKPPRPAVPSVESLPAVVPPRREPPSTVSPPSWQSVPVVSTPLLSPLGAQGAPASLSEPSVSGGDNPMFPEDAEAPTTLSPSEVCAQPLDDETRGQVSPMASLPRGLSASQALVERRRALGQRILSTMGVLTTCASSESSAEATARGSGPGAHVSSFVSPPPGVSAVIERPRGGPGPRVPPEEPQDLYVPPPVRTSFPEQAGPPTAPRVSTSGTWPALSRPTSEEVRDMAMEIRLWERQRRLEREQRGE